MNRFRRLDKPETLDEIVGKVNPGGDMRLDANYLRNCHYVVGATEMRARGYDVVARPTVAGLGRFDRQIEDDWLGDRKFSYRKSAVGTSRAISHLDWVDRETADMPIGARGVVSGAWARGGGGHIFNWEKTAAGIVYHEGQIREHGSDIARQNVLGLTEQSIGIMRVDDLEPSPGIVAAIQSPDERRLDGADRLRNEIARIDERIETLQHALVGQERELDELRHLAEAYEQYQKLVRERKRARSLELKLALASEITRLQNIWTKDRVASTRAVQQAQIVNGTKTQITKWKSERRRVDKELRALS